MNSGDKLRSEVEQELREILVKGSTPLFGLTSMYLYHMGFCDREGNLVELPTGKYLRPLLCLAMCSALGGDPQKAIPAAASLEIGHRTSLIFDDIQDKGQVRNGRPTVWSIWGAEQAINAGLALWTHGRLALHRLKDHGVHDSTILRSWRILETATIDLCGGQWRDLHFVDTGRVSVQDYVEMVQGKTSTLFGAACEFGALLASRDDETLRIARDFGMKMGLAFQIQDDYLGIWGDEEQVGKTANDLMEKKWTLPVVLAVEQFPDKQVTARRTLRDWLKADFISKQVVAEIKTWLEQKGIPEQVREMEKEHLLAATQLLDQLELSTEWADRMHSLLDRAVNRIL